MGSLCSGAEQKLLLPELDSSQQVWLTVFWPPGQRPILRSASWAGQPGMLPVLVICYAAPQPCKAHIASPGADPTALQQACRLLDAGACAQQPASRHWCSALAAWLGRPASLHTAAAAHIPCGALAQTSRKLVALHAGELRRRIAGCSLTTASATASTSGLCPLSA